MSNAVKAKKERGQTMEKMEDISDQTEELLKQLNTFQEQDAAHK